MTPRSPHAGRFARTLEAPLAFAPAEVFVMVFGSVMLRYTFSSGITIPGIAVDVALVHAGL